MGHIPVQPPPGTLPPRPPPPAGHDPLRRGARRAYVLCYRCRKPGHFAAQCTNQGYHTLIALNFTTDSVYGGGHLSWHAASFQPPYPHFTMRVGRPKHTINTSPVRQLVTLRRGVHHSMSPLQRTSNPQSFYSSRHSPSVKESSYSSSSSSTAPAGDPHILTAWIIPIDRNVCDYFRGCGSGECVADSGASYHVTGDSTGMYPVGGTSPAYPMVLPLSSPNATDHVVDPSCRLDPVRVVGDVGTTRGKHHSETLVMYPR